MEIKPLKRYKTPKYPSKSEVLRNPELLEIVPKRWINKPVVKMAMASLMIISLAGCANKKVKKDISKIEVPLFIHGEGRGSFGCVAVLPPVFLSEEEAMNVINEEAIKLGYRFDNEETLELKDVKLPLTTFNDDNPITSKKGILKLDGYNKNLKLGFEYVSLRDYEEWHNENEQVGSSIESYSIKSAAEVLNGGLKGKKNGNIIAVFYDPKPKVDEEDYKIRYDDKEAIDKYYDKMQEKSKEELRKQVQDFIVWLIAQHII